MPTWLAAGFWGLVAGGALVLGAAVAWLATVPQQVIAWVMAFGAGVLISALAFDLVGEASESAGLLPVAGGFLLGAVVYVGANALLARHGAQHRKRSGRQQPSEEERPGSGTAIASGPCWTASPSRSSSDSAWSVAERSAPRCLRRSSSRTSRRGCPARPG